MMHLMVYLITINS